MQLLGKKKSPADFLKEMNGGACVIGGGGLTVRRIPSFIRIYVHRHLHSHSAAAMQTSMFNVTLLPSVCFLLEACQSADCSEGSETFCSKIAL